MRRKVLLAGVVFAMMLAAPGCTRNAPAPVQPRGEDTTTSLPQAAPPPPVRVPLHEVAGTAAFYTGAARSAKGFAVLAPSRLPEGFVLDEGASTSDATGLLAVYRSGEALLEIRESASAMGDVGDDPEATATALGPFPGTLFLNVTGPKGQLGYAVASDQQRGHYYLGSYLLPPEQVREISASMAEVR